MVDSTIKFDEILQQEWDKWYQSKGKSQPKSKICENQFRELENGFLAFYNEKLISNKRPADFKFESDEDENQAKVYKNFDESKFNFNKCQNEEILFYVNLDEEVISTKEQNSQLNEKNLDESENDCDKSVNEFTNHPIIVNISPICKKHSLIPAYVDEQLPQVIGQDILSLVLTTFKLSGSNHLRVQIEQLISMNYLNRLGFNSLGGFSSVNHLHFQLIYADEIFPKDKIFPIEKAKRKLVISSTLQNSNEELNMHSVGVNVEELVDYPVKCLVFSPILQDGQDISEIYSSIAFAVGTYTNILLDEQIPHNIFMSEKGQRVYVIPRQYENDNKEYHDLCRPAFFEFAGLMICRDYKFFNELNPQIIHQYLKKYADLPDKQYNETLTKFKNILQKNFN